MSTTKKILSEQVLFRLYGGDYDISSPVQFPDVYKAIEQIVNSMFKMEQFNSNLPSGETIPNGVMVATYTDVTVSGHGDVSKATLPVFPISLPKNMGIFGIAPAMSLTSLQGHFSFIPLMRGQKDLLRTDTLLNDLMGQIGYEPRNTDVVFTKNCTLLGITKVDMELLVMDISLYSETDILPIPASYEDDIVTALVNKFSPVQPETGQVNLLTSSGQNANK